MIQTELLDLKVGKLKSFLPLSLSFLHRQLVNIFCDCGVLLFCSLTSRQRYDYWKKKALSELSIPHIKKNHKTNVNSATDKSIIFHVEYSNKQTRNSHQYNVQFPFSQFLGFFYSFVVISGDHMLNTDSKKYSMSFEYQQSQPDERDTPYLVLQRSRNFPDIVQYGNIPKDCSSNLSPSNELAYHTNVAGNEPLYSR